MMRVLIVDDEPLALEKLRAGLAAVPGLAVVGAATDGDEALRLVRETAPDLMLLDIQMPGASGLEVARQLARTDIDVVFVTAFSDFAAEAFELDAADYLLKPVAADRLLEAVTRARRRRAIRDLAGPPLARAAARPTDPGAYAREFWIRQADGQVRVPVADIQRIEADRDYALLHTPLRTFILRITMAALEQKLDPAELIRVHRSAFVRPAAVRRVEGHRKTALRLHTGDGAIVDVGASYAGRVLDALGLTEPS